MNNLIISDDVSFIQKNIRCKDDIVACHSIGTRCALQKEFGFSNTVIVVDYNQPFFANEIFGICDKINGFLKGENIYSDWNIFGVSRFYESFFSTIISNQFNNIQFYDSILVKYRIGCVISNRTDYYEYLALGMVCRERNIRLTNRSIRLIPYKVRKLYFYRVASYLFNRLKILREIIKVTEKSMMIENSTLQSFDIGILLYVNSVRHNKWLNQNLKSIPDLSCCVFNMYENLDPEIIESPNGTMIHIEQFVEKKKLVVDYFHYLLDSRKIYRDLRKELEKNPLYFRGVNVNKGILLVLSRLWKETALKYYLYNRALSNVADHVRVRALSTEPSVPEHRLLMYRLMEKNPTMKCYIDDTHLSECMGDALEEMQWPYDPDSIDFIFACGKPLLANVYRKHGWTGDSFLVRSFNLSDFARYDGYRPEAVHRILYAPSKDFPNKLTAERLLSDSLKVIDLAVRGGYNLSVKFHPSQEKTLINEIRKRYANESIDWIEGNYSVNECIKKTDIVITNPSTCIFDAAILHKPVICLADELCHTFVNHIDDNFIIIRSEDLNEELLKKMEINYIDIVKKQDRLIEEMMRQESQNDVLKRILGKKDEYEGCAS